MTKIKTKTFYLDLYS